MEGALGSCKLRQRVLRSKYLDLFPLEDFFINKIFSGTFVPNAIPTPSSTMPISSSSPVKIMS